MVYITCAKCKKQITEKLSVVNKEDAYYSCSFGHQEIIRRKVALIDINANCVSVHYSEIKTQDSFIFSESGCCDSDHIVARCSCGTVLGEGGKDCWQSKAILLRKDTVIVNQDSKKSP